MKITGPRDPGEKMLDGQVIGRSNEKCLSVYLWPEGDQEIHVHIDGFFTGVFVRREP